MNAVISKSLSFKYQKFSASGCKYIGFRKVEFVAKTQFLFQDLSRRSIETEPGFGRFKPRLKFIKFGHRLKRLETELS